MTAGLQLQAVEIALGERRLLGPWSARVGAGEVLAVMGPSGSGKSSLLAWMAGLLEAPLRGAGRLWLDDRELTVLPTEARRIGLLFQDDLLFPHLSVAQNLLFALPVRAGAGRRERAGDIEAALADAELAGLGARLPHELSGGQRARVSLLRALLAQPRALLLDEPFSRLDMALRARMREFTWARLRAAGVPAVIVTHDSADVPTGAACLRIGEWSDA
jgi:putative thiamine transport system ATP-binding protein